MFAAVCGVARWILAQGSDIKFENGHFCFNLVIGAYEKRYRGIKTRNEERVTLSIRPKVGVN